MQGTSHPHGVMTEPDDLWIAASERGIRIPVRKTLAIYGLDARLWLEMFQSQEWKCPVCLRSSSHWNIDHQHVIGWKRMPPEVRRTYVRGILCWLCNKDYAPSNMTSAEAFRLAKYLADYEERRRKK